MDLFRACTRFLRRSPLLVAFLLSAPCWAGPVPADQEEPRHFVDAGLGLGIYQISDEIVRGLRWRGPSLELDASFRYATQTDRHEAFLCIGAAYLEDRYDHAAVSASHHFGYGFSRRVLRAGPWGALFLGGQRPERSTAVVNRSGQVARLTRVRATLLPRGDLVTMHLGAPSRSLAIGAFVCAVLVAASALGGIFLPSTYAAETLSWATQGMAQDWVDLLVAVPWLIVCGVFVARGSRAGEVLLGGAAVYLGYSYVLYAFDVHFNRLFLLYCATLGCSFFTLAGISARALRDDLGATLPPEVPVKAMGWLLIVLAIVFYALWLSEDVPALLKGVAPESLAEVNLPSNPVHVIDLSVVLPAMASGGVALLRRRPIGAFVGAVMLSFSVLMTIAILAMMLFMRHCGLTANPTPTVVMGIVATASAVVVGRFLWRFSAASR